MGGYYGASSELAMMKEIRSRGPIVSDLDVPIGFSYYKDGIFSDEHIKMMKELGNPDFVKTHTSSNGGVNSHKLNDYHIEW